MNLNTGSIYIDARNAAGEPVRNASAEFLLYNHRLRSLDSVYRVKLTGAPVLLKDVPAFPFGSADLMIKIDRYRTKKRFVHVQPEQALELEEYFFLDPAQAKARFPALSHPAFRALAIEPGKLSDLEKAGLLNIHAKLASLDLADLLEEIIEIRPDRIFARVGTDLIDQVRESQDLFSPASGISHKFPKGWRRVETLGSFKTRERQGNLQLTFAENSDGQYLVDIDIDDNQGIAHAFDVIGHALSGATTHPYNIHQILVALQGIEPGYRLT